MPVAPGRALGTRYRVVSPLARGGMASVWLAEDTLLDRRVAVKTLHPDLAVDEALRTRFRHEAVAAAQLSHPNIVTTYDTGEDDGVAYIVMEFVEGLSLRGVLDKRAPLPVDEAAHIGEQAARALDYAHRHGIVHRDVKPANVLVPNEGPVKVTDFGIAKAVGATTEDLTRTGTVMGTARYLAPEQLDGRAVDGRADVYSLGLVLYEMLTAQLPFRGDTEMATAIARLSREAPPLRSVRPDAPAAAEAVLAAALAQAPEARYQSAGEFADALASLRNPTRPPVLPAGAPTPLGDATDPPTRPEARPEKPLTPPPSSTPTPTPRPASRPPTRPPRRALKWPVVLLVLAILVLTAAVAYLAVDRAGLGNDTPGGSSSNAGAVSISAVKDFDPFGNPPSEHPETVHNTIDKNPNTSWSTSTYSTPNFGNAKPGLGLVLALGARSTVKGVEIDSADGGWNAEVYVSDTNNGDFSDWQQHGRAGRISEASSNATITLDRSASGQYVLVWFTKLPSSGKLTVNEVKLA